MSADAEFEGFSPDLYAFLKDLAANNKREWFKPHQDRYEASVREPARAFIRAMEPLLEQVAPHLVADDRKVGGSLMRVFRDVRFSKDKTPYKTNVGIQFRHDAGKNVHAPGLYLHVSADENFVCMGMWRPDKDALAGIRAKIDAEADRWTEILADKQLAANYRQAGESLKRPPRGFAKDHPMIDEIKRKTFIALRDLTPEQITAPDLPAFVQQCVEETIDYAIFLCEAIGHPF